MNVRYIGKDQESLKNGMICEVLSVEKGLLRVKTAAGKTELIPPEQCETLMRNWHFDADEIFHD